VSLAAQIDGITFFVALPNLFFCYHETDSFAHPRLATESLIQQGWDPWPGGIDLTPSGTIIPPGWSAAGDNGQFRFDNSVNPQTVIKVIRACFGAQECIEEREFFADFEVWAGKFKIGLLKHIVQGTR
jgi:hypothetical protein